MSPAWMKKENFFPCQNSSWKKSAKIICGVLCSGDAFFPELKQKQWENKEETRNFSAGFSSFSWATLFMHIFLEVCLEYSIWCERSIFFSFQIRPLLRRAVPERFQSRSISTRIREQGSTRSLWKVRSGLVGFFFWQDVVWRKSNFVEMQAQKILGKKYLPLEHDSNFFLT